MSTIPLSFKHVHNSIICNLNKGKCKKIIGLKLNNFYRYFLQKNIVIPMNTYIYIQIVYLNKVRNIESLLLQYNDAPSSPEYDKQKSKREQIFR